MHIDLGLAMRMSPKHGYQDAYAAYDWRNLEVRQANRGVLFVVTDGAGTADFAAGAAKEGAKAFAPFFTDASVPANESGLRTLAAAADQRVASWGFSEGTDRPVGIAAMTAVWLSPDKHAVIVQAGDTAAFRIIAGKDSGTAIRLTPDDSVGHGLLRYLGRGDAQQFHVEPRPFSDGDTMVLVSDGVTKVLSGFELAQIVFGSKDSQLAADKIAELAFARHAHDDITALVVYLED